VASPIAGAVFRAIGSTSTFAAGSRGSIRRTARACTGPQTT
jgi:hypothetical protein